MIATVCLLGLMAVACATDIAWHKIYNWNTYSGIVLALVLSGLASFTATQHLAAIPLADSPLLASTIGLLACGLLMLVCFVFFNVGGGDVKLLAMVGAFLGVDKGIETLLWTFVLGGAMGVMLLVWKLGPVKVVSHVARQLTSRLGLTVAKPLPEEEQHQWKMPLYLAPSALAAVTIVHFSLLS